MSIEKQVEDAFEVALTFLDSHGVRFKRKPTYNLSLQSCLPEHVSVGKVIVPNNVEDELKYITLSYVTRLVFEKYCISVSTSAVKQYLNTMMPHMNAHAFDTFDSSADIVIDPKPIGTLKSNIIGSVLVHELFHVWELQEGVLASYPYVLEGTATYAQDLFTGRKVDAQFKPNGIIEQIYLGGRKNVETVLTAQGLKLSEVAHPTVRENIFNEFDISFRNFYLTHIPTPVERKVGMAMMKTIPVIGSRLSEGVNHNNLVSAYCEFGATQLADELSVQNTDKYQAELVAMGFPKK